MPHWSFLTQLSARISLIISQGWVCACAVHVAFCICLHIISQETISHYTSLVSSCCSHPPRNKYMWESYLYNFEMSLDRLLISRPSTCCELSSWLFTLTEKRSQATHHKAIWKDRKILGSAKLSVNKNMSSFKNMWPFHLIFEHKHAYTDINRLSKLDCNAQNAKLYWYMLTIIFNSISLVSAPYVMTGTKTPVVKTPVFSRISY